MAKIGVIVLAYSLSSAHHGSILLDSEQEKLGNTCSVVEFKTADTTWLVFEY